MVHNGHPGDGGGAGVGEEDGAAGDLYGAAPTKPVEHCRDVSDGGQDEDEGGDGAEGGVRLWKEKG